MSVCTDRQNKDLLERQATGRGNPLGPPNMKAYFWFPIPLTHNHIYG